MAAMAMFLAFTRDIGLPQIGFTLAVAVALDATIILAVVLPATLRSSGDRPWYLPSPREWLPGERPDPRGPVDVEIPRAAGHGIA